MLRSEAQHVGSQIMRSRLLLIVLLVLVASSCIGPPFYGTATIGHDTAHHGWPAVDFRLPQNTPLRAVADGTIVQAGVGAERGEPHRFVVLRLDVADRGCRRIAYKHLNGYRVAVGDRVSAGQIIARSGNDIVRRPHLHFDCQPDDDSLFNMKPPELQYPIIESCADGRWSLHDSDTFKRGERVTFASC